MSHQQHHRLLHYHHAANDRSGSCTTNRTLTTASHECRIDIPLSSSSFGDKEKYDHHHHDDGEEAAKKDKHTVTNNFNLNRGGAGTLGLGFGRNKSRAPSGGAASSSWFRSAKSSLNNRPSRSGRKVNQSLLKTWFNWIMPPPLFVDDHHKMSAQALGNGVRTNVLVRSISYHGFL